MKKLQKVMALVLAVVMCMSLMTTVAFAYEGDTHSDDTWTGAADNAISITGLAKDDTVKFYKVLDYDQTASMTVAEAKAITNGKTDWHAAGWKVIEPFNTGDNALTLEEFKSILTKGINADLAGKIAKNATGTANYTVQANESGEASQSEPGAGLYVAIITPQNAGVMYNPIFVASDYYTTTGGDKSSTWAPVETPLSYSDSAMAKKAPVTVTKKAEEKEEATNETDGAKAVGKGDVVDFTVSTTIPEFADNYTAPVFVVTDKMTSGLEVVGDSVKVYAYDGKTEISAKKDDQTQYTITYDADKKGYKVAFDSTYLLRLKEATGIVIKYSATVTESATENVNVEENTVTVTYSHEPSVTDESKGKKVGDKTHHYSFTIDGNIWGESTSKSTEVVKVGLDKDGNEIEQKVELINGKKIGALEGAEFKLYTDANCSTEYNKGDYATNKKIVSDSEGRLTYSGTTTGISGLDAGTYYLKETKAPAGYIMEPKATKIEIIPTYYTEVTWTDENGIEIKSDDILKSYIVKINDVQTAEYNLTYEMNDTLPKNDKAQEDTDHMKTTNGNIVIGNSGPITTVEADKQDSDAYGKIQNTQGTELPSTGGMGTTPFYVIGAILVVGAMIVMMTRRRVHAQND